MYSEFLCIGASTCTMLVAVTIYKQPYVTVQDTGKLAMVALVSMQWIIIILLVASFHRGISTRGAFIIILLVAIHCDCDYCLFVRTCQCLTGVCTHSFLACSRTWCPTTLHVAEEPIKPTLQHTHAHRDTDTMTIRNTDNPVCYTSVWLFKTHSKSMSNKWYNASTFPLICPHKSQLI